MAMWLAQNLGSLQDNLGDIASQVSNFTQEVIAEDLADDNDGMQCYQLGICMYDYFVKVAARNFVVANFLEGIC